MLRQIERVNPLLRVFHGEENFTYRVLVHLRCNAPLKRGNFGGAGSISGFVGIFWRLFKHDSRHASSIAKYTTPLFQAESVEQVFWFVEGLVLLAKLRTLLIYSRWNNRNGSSTMTFSTWSKTSNR
jgi:hypothetical protein